MSILLQIKQIDKIFFLGVRSGRAGKQSGHYFLFFLLLPFYFFVCPCVCPLALTTFGLSPSFVYLLYILIFSLFLYFSKWERSLNSINSEKLLLIFNTRYWFIIDLFHCLKSTQFKAESYRVNRASVYCW